MSLNNGSSRLQWYDRTPLEINQQYDASAIAPAVQTTRWTYTVPANRKCIVDSAQVTMIRNTVATTPSLVVAFIVTNGGARVVMTKFYGNVVDLERQMNLSGVTNLLAAAFIFAATQDNSTGGSVDYTISAHGVEYDA